jgi:hypothetical protein
MKRSPFLMLENISIISEGYDGMSGKNDRKKKFSEMWN